MQGQGRPVLVWLIFLYFMFSTAFTLVSVLVLTSGSLPPELQEQMNVEALRPIDMVTGFIETIVYFSAAIALFMKRKLAFYLFAGAFVLDLGLIVWMLADESRAAALGVADDDVLPFVSVIGVGISLLLVIYTLKLMLSERLA